MIYVDLRSHVGNAAAKLTELKITIWKEEKAALCYGRLSVFSFLAKGGWINLPTCFQGLGFLAQLL